MENKRAHLPARPEGLSCFLLFWFCRTHFSLARGIGLGLIFVSFLSFAQPKSDLAPPPPIDPVEGDRQGRELVARLLEQRPQQAVTNTALLKITDAKGNQRLVPARFDIVPTATNWLNIYEIPGTNSTPTAKLTIIHSDAQANQYLLRTSEAQGSPGGLDRKLSANDLMVPFAGSDFWIADLGLEFLHWPQQRVLRVQMRKGLSCAVLQSINPQPSKDGYARVESWIAINRPEDVVIVHAEAFDAQDRLIKEFDPKKVEKVNGLWQLEEMEIRNRPARTKTRIGFNLAQ
jgi:hypothetical protein